MRVRTKAPRRSHRFRWAPPIILGWLAAGACGGDSLILPQDGTPAALVILGGDGQADTVGRVLRDSLVVRITDPGNRPIQHQAVHFLEPSGPTGARVIPDTAQTDIDGRATVRWVLGTVAGPQRIRAAVDAPGGELTVDFNAAGIVAAPDTILAVSGDSQGGVVGSALGQLLVATVTDRYGNPVSGIRTTWAVTGGGSVSPTATISGSNGQVAVRRTLGASPGEQRAVVTATGLKGSPVVFVQQSIQGQPANLIAESGNDQSGLPSTPLSRPLVVRLVDAMGNGLAGQAVAWPVATGGGTVVPASGTTDATGHASGTWTLGPIAGTNVVVAGSSGLTTTFTATSSPTQPATIAATSPTSWSGTTGTPASPAPSVRITDAQGHPVIGVVVTFQVTRGGGSVVPVTAPTDVNGSATPALWMLGLAVGPNTLSVSASGANGALSGSPVLFTVAAAAGPMNRLTIVGQPSPSGVTGVPLARVPVVQLQDVNGNDVGGSGVVVTATLAGSPPGASLASATASTDAGGTATFAGLTLTGPAATYTLLFTSVPSLSGATSSGITLSGMTQGITMLVQPSASVANGAVWQVQPAVLVADQNGFPVQGASVSAAVVSGAATLGGQTVISTSILGVAVFSNLSLTGTTGSYTLRLSTGTASTVTTVIGLTPGPATASQSTAVVPSKGKTRRQTAITVQTRDQSGNGLTAGGHTVTISVTGANRVNGFTAPDNGDGSYTTGYTPTRKGNDFVTITLDGTPIAGSPYLSDVK
ncbi:MAG: filamin/ABP280 repeat domain-containing protein [Gemmatimonadales bacterium]